MSRLSDTIERKFVDSIDIDEYEIWTDTGWEEITSIHKTVEYVEWVLELDNGMSLICADDHIVFDENFDEIFVKDLNVGDHIITEDGVVMVSAVYETTSSSNMYDVTVDSANHRLYTNGILSHNTTSAAAIVLHYILFNEEKTVALLANKADAAREILDRVQIAYQNLPKWLQQGVLEWNKGSIKLENGCKVIAAASSASSIRGKSISFLYIDETAFLENWDEFYSSVYPTISSGKETKILLTSTPRGLNHFHKMCSEAMEIPEAALEQGSNIGKNGFIYIEVKWDRIPGRDEQWKNETLASMGWNYDQFSQEFECVANDTEIELYDTHSGEFFTTTIQHAHDNLLTSPKSFKQRKTIVYKLTRNDGKDYIGITVDFGKRLKQHYKSERFSIGIKDYEILSVCDTYEEAGILEEFYIKKYNTVESGLNISINGKGNHCSEKFTTRNFKYNDSSRKLMSDKAKERYASGNNKLKNRVVSEKEKKKHSDFRKGKYNKKRVIDNETANKIIDDLENLNLIFSDEFIKSIIRKSDIDKVGKLDYTFLKCKNGHFLTYKILLREFYSRRLGVTKNAIDQVIKVGRDYANTIEY